MKSIAAVIALSIATAFAASAIAQTAPTNQAECEKMADKKWDDSSKTCLPK